MRAEAARSRQWLILAGGAALAAAAAIVFWFAVVRPARDGPAGANPQPLAPLLPAPAKDTPAAGLRPELREILGFVPATRPSRRLELLRACGTDLGDPECEALLAALAQRRDPATDAGWHAEYVHEISLVLRRHPQARERFARVLAAVAADATRDEVVRDYALQHLRQVWEHAGDEPELRASIVETFRLVAARDPVLGASGLLSLHLLGFHPDGQDDAPAAAVPTAELEPMVRQALASPPAQDQVRLRMSSLRVASERGMRGMLPEIRRIAANAAGEHALARMAAIAAIGRLAQPADRALLESLESSCDPRIAGAVRHALAGLP